MGFSRIVLLGTLAVTAGLAVGCKKSRVVDDSEPWLPATEANGFHAVEPFSNHAEPCMKAPPPLEQRSPARRTTLATASQKAKVVVADESHVYWIDGEEKNAAGTLGYGEPPRPPPLGGTSIERVARASGGRLRIAVPEAGAEDLAVDARHLYWSVAASGGGPPGIWSWEKGTGRVRAVAHEASGRIVAAPLSSESALAWTVAPREVRISRGGGAAKTLTTLGDLVPGVLALDHTTVYAAARGLLWAIPIATGSPTQIGYTTTPPDDMAVDGEWLYWIEAGASREYCAPDGTPPARNRYQDVPRPNGTLKRVRTSGGNVEIVAVDLLDVYKLTVRNGIAWIATPHGVLRIEGRGHVTIDAPRSTVRVAAVDEGIIGSFFTSAGIQEVALLRAP